MVADRVTRGDLGRRLTLRNGPNAARDEAGQESGRRWLSESVLGGYGVSCPAARTCVAVGDYSVSSSGLQSQALLLAGPD